MAKEIVMTFGEDGQTHIEGFGFVGPECDKAMKPFEMALGTVKEMKKKPEYVKTAIGTKNRENAK